MGKKIMYLLERPLYPYLYGVAFIAYKSARYFPSFSFLTAFAFFTVFCVGCFVMARLFRKIFPSPYTGICIVLLLMSLLHVAAVAQAVGYNYSYIPKSFYLFFYLAVIVLIIVALFVFSKAGDRYTASFNKTANVFLVIITCVFISNGILYEQQTYAREHRKSYTGKKIPVQKQKDIIWFLFDEYPSAVSLKQQFVFDNPLEKQLADEGFVMLDDMRSRFNNTLYSLNAIFNKDDSVAPANFYTAVRSLEQNTWTRELDSSGYEVVNLGIFDLGSHAKLADRSGYPQTFWQQLITGTVINVIGNEIKFSIQKCDLYTQEVLKKLNDTLNAPSDKRRFIWVHIGIPHEPFCRDNKGDLLTKLEYTDSDSSLVKKSLLEYLQYGNNVLTEILKDHPAIFNDIIVVSGDHGPRYTFLRNKEYQKWPLAAVMIPGKYDTVQLRQLRYISQIPSFLMDQLAKQ